jgi:hypothetical protein
MSIEAQTLVVNAHGGLLEAGIDIPAGQQIILSNPETGRIESCKVLRVEGSNDGRYAIAFEFSFPAPRFWPVDFPPQDWL